MPKWSTCGVNGWFRGCLFCACTLVLACSAEQTTPGEVYLQRLADALQTNVKKPVAPTPIAFPQRRELLLDIPRQEISVVEFANLHRCDMGGLIGARNSGLGRLAGDMERLRYELAWIFAAERCVAAGQTWLDEHLIEKRENLPRVVWNATVASPQFSSAMGATGDSLNADVTPLQGITDMTAELLQHHRHVPEYLDATVTDLSSTLRDLAAQLRIGRRLQSWQQTTGVLEAATAALADRQGRICLTGQPTPRMHRLVRVFQNYYLARWQAEFAPRLARDRQWIDALQRLIQLHAGVATPAFMAWFETSVHARTSVWNLLQSAIQSHVQVWQQLLQSCGMQVTDLREDQ